jgi:hypothetical protein
VVFSLATIGMAVPGDGNGYALITSDGQVHNFGDAAF